MSGVTVAPEDHAESIRVLHVDDNPNLAEIAERMLREESDRIETETVEDAAAALERLDEGGVDCVVSDYDMPGRNGIELLEAVRDRYPDLPFILFTGKGSEEVASAAISAGATDYLQKSTGTEQYAILANRVENAVEQYHSERTARRTERRLRELAEHTPDVRWMFTADWDEVLFINSAYEKIYGDAVERLHEDPQSHLEATHPEDRERVKRAMERITDGEEVSFEYRVNPEEDYGRWVEVSGGPVYEDGDVVRVVGYTREITRRKEREQELKRHDAVLTALNDAVYALDDQGHFTYVNDAFVELTGYDRDAVIGSDPGIIKDEAARSKGRYELGKLLSDDHAESNAFEITIQPREGDAIPCEDQMAVLYDDDGEFRGSAGVLRDLTERRDREAELRETRRLLTESLDALDDIYYMLDGDGTIQRWNDTLEEITGHDGETLAEMNTLEFFAPEDRDRVGAALQEAIEDGTARVTASVETTDGNRIPYEFTGARLDDSDGDLQGVIGVGRDITERRERERDLERTNERLEEFAGLVSHDLRNPLTAISSNLELYRTTGDESHLDELEATVERMERLVDDLLQVARGGEAVEETEPVSLAEVVDAARVGAMPSSASLSVDAVPPLRADPDRLHQLVENLLRNAAEHAGDAPSVTVGPVREQGNLTGFFVADDGPGIPPERREDVLESGFTTSDNGTGYGLSVVQSIVEAHGWTLSITGSETGGTRVEVGGVEFAEADAE